MLPAFLSPLTLSSNNNVKDRKIDSGGREGEGGEMQGERDIDRIVLQDVLESRLYPVIN